MLDFYRFVNGNRMFRQFHVSELVFTAYDCPIEEELLDYWTQKNYFFYIVKGGLKWKLPGSELNIGVGDAVFLKRGAHTAYKVVDGDLCGLLIFMPDEFINDILQKHTINLFKEKQELHTDSVIPIEVDETLLNFFISMLSYFSQTNPPSESLLKIRFEEFIVNIITSRKNRLLTQYFYELCCDRNRSIKSIMEHNYTYNLRLSDYATMCNRSLATFKRDFFKIYHTTPGRWLKSKRLEYGKFLLVTTEKNISEITLESGFENTSHFIKSFKEKYNFPPFQYRKILQRS